MKVDDVVSAKDSYNITVRIESFAEVTNIYNVNNRLVGDIKTIEDNIDIDEQEQQQMLEFIKKLAEELQGDNTEGPDIEAIFKEYNTLNTNIGFASQWIQLNNKEKYKLMETFSLRARALLFIEYLRHFKERMSVKLELAERFSEKTNKSYREAALREQMRIIQEELNETSGSGDNKKKDYRTRIEEANLPEQVLKVALEEVDKFEAQQPTSPDYNIIRNYLDFILELPWHVDEDEDIL